MASRGWLASQTAAFRRAALEGAQFVALEAGARVYHVGDGPGGVYGVVSGGVGVYAPGRDGALRLGHILRAGDWFGTRPFLSGRERAMTFRAMEPSRALQLPLASLLRLAGEDAGIARSLGALADFEFDLVASVASDLLIPDSAKRLAAVMLRVADGDLRSRTEAVSIRVTQSELGEMANLSRRAVSGALGRFAANAWVVVGYSALTITNPQALAEFVESGE